MSKFPVKVRVTGLLYISYGMSEWDFGFSDLHQDHLTLNLWKKLFSKSNFSGTSDAVHTSAIVISFGCTELALKWKVSYKTNQNFTQNISWTYWTLIKKDGIQFTSVQFRHKTRTAVSMCTETTSGRSHMNRRYCSMCNAGRIIRTLFYKKIENTHCKSFLHKSVVLWFHHSSGPGLKIINGFAVTFCRQHQMEVWALCHPESLICPKQAGIRAFSEFTSVANSPRLTKSWPPNTALSCDVLHA